MIEVLLHTNADWVLTVTRLLLGIIFFAHGAQKMLGWFGGPGLHATLQMLNQHLRLPGPIAFLVLSAELFGGLGLIVGLLSRIAAAGIVLTIYEQGLSFDPADGGIAERADARDRGVTSR
jgi:putative oxidoreductase